MKEEREKKDRWHLLWKKLQKLGWLEKEIEMLNRKVGDY